MQCAPLSNGKLERWHQSIKRESIRPRCPLSAEDAREIAGEYVQHYNTRRLHSAIGYVTPADKLAGREQEIFAARDRKLEAARQQRQSQRRAAMAMPAAEEEKPSQPQKSGLTHQTPAVKVAMSRETEAGSAEEQPAEG